MSETGCLKDGHFNNLEVDGEANGGNYVFNGYSRSSSLPPVSLLHSSYPGGTTYAHGGSIINDIDSTTNSGHNWDNCEKLFQWLSVRDILTDAEAENLYGQTAGTVKKSTIADAAADAANTTAFDNTLGIQYLTGTWGDATTSDIGAMNPRAAMADNAQTLVVFGSDVVSTGEGVLKLKIDGTGTDKIDTSQSFIAFSGLPGTPAQWTITVGSGNDNVVDIVLKPQSGTVIEKGSFIYLENTGADLVAVRGYLKISGATLTSATC